MNNKLPKPEESMPNMNVYEIRFHNYIQFPDGNRLETDKPVAIKQVTLIEDGFCPSSHIQISELCDRFKEEVLRRFGRK